MSEYQNYYEAFTARLVHGEGLAPEACRCNGGGWILSDVDTLHKCPDHYAGQPHPEDDPCPGMADLGVPEVRQAVDAAIDAGGTEDDCPF